MKSIGLTTLSCGLAVAIFAIPAAAQRTPQIGGQRTGEPRTDLQNTGDLRSGDEVLNRGQQELDRRRQELEQQRRFDRQPVPPRQPAERRFNRQPFTPEQIERQERYRPQFDQPRTGQQQFDRQQTDQRQDQSQRAQRQPAAQNGGQPVVISPGGWVTIHIDYDRDGKIDRQDTVYYYDLVQAQRESQRRRNGESQREEQRPDEQVRRRPDLQDQRRFDQQDQQPQEPRRPGVPDRDRFDQQEPQLPEPPRQDRFDQQEPQRPGLQDRDRFDQQPVEPRRPDLQDQGRFDQQEPRRRDLQDRDRFDQQDQPQEPRRPDQGEQRPFDQRQFDQQEPGQFDEQDPRQLDQPGQLDQPAQPGADEQEAETVELEGTIEEQASFTMRGHEDEKFVIARIKTEDGETTRAVLGMSKDLKELDLSKGDSISLKGEEHRINDKPVIFARSVTAKDKTVKVTPPESQGEQRLRGTIENLESRRIPGRDGEFLVAQLNVANGRRALINLGERSQLESLNLQEGDEISVLARGGEIEGRPALVAAEVVSDGQSASVNRTRSESAEDANEETPDTSEDQTDQETSPEQEADNMRNR